MKKFLEGSVYTVTPTDSSPSARGASSVGTDTSFIKPATDLSTAKGRRESSIKASALNAYINLKDIISQSFTSLMGSAMTDANKAPDAEEMIAKTLINQESLTNFFAIRNSVMRTLRFKRKMEVNEADNNQLFTYKGQLTYLKTLVNGNTYPSSPYDLQMRLSDAEDSFNANIEADKYRNVASGKLPIATFLKPFTTLYDNKIHQMAIEKLYDPDKEKLFDQVYNVDTSGNAKLETLKQLELDNLQRMLETTVTPAVTNNTQTTATPTSDALKDVPFVSDNFTFDNKALGLMPSDVNADLKQNILKQKETQDRLNYLVQNMNPEMSAALKNPINVQDTLIRPGMPPIKFRADDLILKYKDGTIAAGTNLMGDDNSPTTVIPPSTSYVMGNQNNTSTNNVPAPIITNNNNDSDSKKIIELLTKLIQKVDQPVILKIGNKALMEMNKQTSVQKSYSAHIGNTYGAT